MVGGEGMEQGGTGKQMGLVRQTNGPSTVTLAAEG